MAPGRSTRAASGSTPRHADARPTWRNLLRSERKRLGLTQAQVATLANISPETIRKYESGDRTPPREILVRLVEGIGVPQETARAILGGAGFSSDDSRFPPDEFPDYYFSVRELVRHVETVPWPEFVVNSGFEIVAANRVAQTLWGVDLATERARRSAAELSLLAIAAERAFAEHMVNWDEVVAALIAALKGGPLGAPSVDLPDTPFGNVLAQFAASNPAAVPRLFAVWEKTQPRRAKVRWSYRVVWRDDHVGELRFLSLISVASEPDALGFNDWIPLDAETWERLGLVTAKSESGE